MRTFDQSASSSSASIRGSEVSDPCPISAAGDMIATVSSVEIVTHGLKATSLPAASAVPNGRRAATANVNPAAPIMKPRRPTSALRIWIVMSALLRGALDGANNALVGAAAADIGAHV